MKKYKYKTFAILAIDKELGGISSMIEHSTSVIASEAKEVNLFLLKGSATLEKIREVFISDTKVNIHEITYIDKVLFNLGLLNLSIKKILLSVDYILFHNIKLINVLQKFNKIKPLFFFFHTDKYKHIKRNYGDLKY